MNEGMKGIAESRMTWFSIVEYGGDKWSNKFGTKKIISILEHKVAGRFSIWVVWNSNHYSEMLYTE